MAETPQQDESTGAPVRVLSGGALRALAHPLRAELYDRLSQYGPQTASSLAAAMGESSGATSYHLRVLAKHDLIREVVGRGTARERWWERVAGGVSLANPDMMATPSGRATSRIVLNDFAQRRHQQLLAYIAGDLESDPDHWRDAAMVSTGNARLTVDQLADLTARMQALIDETVERYRSQRGEGVRPVTIHADVFPLPEGGQ